MRCINCGTAIQRLLIHAIPSLSSDHQSRLSRWITNNQYQDEDFAPPEPDENRDANQIRVFCPQCNTEVSHTAEGMQLDQTKIIVAKVYHYFEQEYEELKKTLEGIDQTPLSKIRQRTALATGVSETMVLEILQEEERRNEEKRQQTLQEQSRALKRLRQTDSASEDGDSDDNGDGDDGQPCDDDETETLVIKEEPDELENDEPEVYVELPTVKPSESGDHQMPADPIAIELKTEPPSEEATTSYETQAVQHASKSSKMRKIQREMDTIPATNVPPAESASPGTSTAPGTSAPPRRQLLLLDDGEVKMKQIETGEDGFS